MFDIAKKLKDKQKVDQWEASSMIDHLISIEKQTKSASSVERSVTKTIVAPIKSQSPVPRANQFPEVSRSIPKANNLKAPVSRAKNTTDRDPITGKKLIRANETIVLPKEVFVVPPRQRYNLQKRDTPLNVVHVPVKMDPVYVDSLKEPSRIDQKIFRKLEKEQRKFENPTEDTTSQSLKRPSLGNSYKIPKKPKL